MSSVQRIYRWSAVILGLLAIGPAYYAITLDWSPRVDFDVIGFLWLLQNLPRLTAFAITAGFLGIAVRSWLRSL
jgi:hypothetical protein